jgi:hypothetical protein
MSWRAIRLWHQHSINLPAYETRMTRQAGDSIPVPRIAPHQRVVAGVRILRASLEVTSGLEGDEQLIVNAPDGLKEGITVRPQGA